MWVPTPADERNHPGRMKSTDGRVFLPSFLTQIRTNPPAFPPMEERKKMSNSEKVVSAKGGLFWKFGSRHILS